MVRSTERTARKEPHSTWLDDRIEDLQTWAHGKPWFLYLPLLLWMVYITVRTIRDYDYSSFIGGLNLGIHEAGHLLFFWGGQDLMAAGGTIAQLIAPLIVLWQFARQKEYFGITFTICWLGTNLVGVARYMADAQALMLPLVSYAPGPATHDWQYLLTRAGLLEHDTQIAELLRNGGIVLLILSSLAGAYLVWEILLQRVLKTDKDL